MDRLSKVLVFISLFLVQLNTAPDAVFSGPIMRTISSGSSTLNNGLVAYWKLDESSDGSSQTDRSDSEPTGTAQTLTDVNTVPNGTGKIGNCANLTRTSSERFNRNDSSDLSGGSGKSMTFVAWVKLTSKVNGYVASKSAASNIEFGINYTAPATDRFGFFVSNDGTATASVTANTLGAPSLATWYFLVVYHEDGVGIGISVTSDGAGSVAAFDTTAHTTGIFDGTGPFQLGAFQSGTHFDGMIDEVGFWSRKLNASELSELYASGSGKTCCAFAAP